MAEENNNFNDAINLLNQGQIVGRLRNVLPEPTGFSYDLNLIQMGRDIPFSYSHFDIDALFTIPMRHFIVGCINYSRTQTNDIQFMVTGKTEGEEDEEQARVREINEEISINCFGLGVAKINVNMGNHIRYNRGNSFLLPLPPLLPDNYMNDVFVNQEGRVVNHVNRRGRPVGSYIHIDTAYNAVNFLQNLGNTQGYTDKSIIGICVVNVETMIQQIQQQITRIEDSNLFNELLMRRSSQIFRELLSQNPPIERIRDSQLFNELLRITGRQNGNSPMRIKSKSSSCRDCKLYLSQFLVKDLKKIAKQFDCKNSSNMTKSELIKYILAHHKK